MSDRGQPVPKRIRRLIYRLCQLSPGEAYQLYIVIPDDDREPYWSIVPLGKLENYGQPANKLVK